MTIKITKVNEADVFAECSYTYYRIDLSKGPHLLSEFTDCVLILQEGWAVCGKYTLSPGDSLYSKGVGAVISGNGVILVAEVPDDKTEPTTVFTKCEDHYTVTKPWGYEMWINGDHPKYCLKKIFIKAGTQTSLQYHNFKEETNVIMNGTATLVYKKDLDVPNDDVLDAHLGEMLIDEPTSIHIMPKTIHRLKASTDLLLFEVSTPYLNDVIRIQDDAGRGNGRVDEEHK